MLKVVGTLFIKDRKLLLDKPRKRPTHQMVGGKVEPNETPTQAAYREACEELVTDTLDPSLFEFIMDFEETASSDPNLKIHFHLFRYNGILNCEPQTSDEIEGFLWYNTSLGESMLTPTLKHYVIPYCIKNNLID